MDGWKEGGRGRVWQRAGVVGAVRTGAVAIAVALPSRVHEECWSNWRTPELSERMGFRSSSLYMDLGNFGARICLETHMVYHTYDVQCAMCWVIG